MKTVLELAIAVLYLALIGAIALVFRSLAKTVGTQGKK